MGKKVYLGDGLYARFDGYHIELTAEDGLNILHRVYLHEGVYQNLVAFHNGLTTEDQVATHKTGGVKVIRFCDHGYDLDELRTGAVVCDECSKRISP